MSILSERLTPAWVIQFYSGIKVLFYLASLAQVPFEVRAGHAFSYSPFNDFPETGWRVAFRVIALAAWLAVFLWAGGKLWRSTTRKPATLPKSD